MNIKNIVLLAKDNKSNSFDENKACSSKKIYSQGHKGLFSSLIEVSSTNQDNSSRYDSADLASSLYTNADKILKRIAQEVETYHNLTPKKTQKVSSSSSEIFHQPCPVPKDQHEPEKCTKKIRKSKREINKQADDKMKKDIVGLKNKFGKMEEPVPKQQIWQIHDKYTFIIESMAKELFQERKKYQQLLNFYKGTDGTNNNSNIFDEIKNKSNHQGSYHEHSNGLLTIDEVSEEQQRTSVAKLSEQPNHNKEDFRNNAFLIVNQPKYDMRKSKTTENLINVDNSIIQANSQPTQRNQQLMRKNLRLGEQSENSMVTKMQLLLESGSKNYVIQSRSLVQDRTEAIQNNLDHIPVSILDKSTSSLKKSLIKQIGGISQFNEQFTQEIIQIQAKYQGIFIDRQCKNQQYINAVDEYYQQHINNIYQNAKNAIQRVMQNPDSAQQQFRILQKLQLEELKKQIHILRTNNKNMVKILGEELQERISCIVEEIYRTEFQKLITTNQELVEINKKLQNYVNKLNEERGQFKNTNTTFDDRHSSRSVLNIGCQTHQMNQAEKKSLQLLENHMIQQYEKILQKQIEMTEKEVILSSKIEDLQKKVRQLEEIRQMDYEIFQRQKQYMKMVFDKETTKLKDQLNGNGKFKKNKNNQNVGFNKHMRVFKQKNSISPHSENIDFKESTVKSINLNENYEQIKSKSPFDEFPELLSNLVFKKTMTIETGGHSSHGGD